MAKLNTDYAAQADSYSYSDSGESDVLEIVKTGETTFSDSNPSWPVRYHLSEERLNLLSWYEFDRDATLLEVGAGCGALTGLFCDRVREVTAVELTRQRAEIIYNRYKERDNLTIFAGNLNEIQLEQKFDYLTCIGVLEYAGRYTDAENPYASFLKLLKGYLKPKGTLILAIENKFGLKYWSGVNEDHTGRVFDSIENYPARQGIKTFSKNELDRLLAESGFASRKFFYPLPDYKLPTEIFSDNYLPTALHGVRPGIFPFVDFSGSRDFFFDEKLAMDNIINSGMFDFFANSFLVFAKG